MTVLPDFRSHSGQAEIDKAFSTVMNAAAVSRCKSDAAPIVVFGGERTRSEREYIAAFIEMVNYNAFGNGPAEFVAEGNASAGTRFTPRKTFHLVKLLDKIAIGISSSQRQRYRAFYDRQVAGKVLDIPTFRGPSRGKRTVVLKEAAQAYTLLSLLDEAMAESVRLRRCKLESCGRFFLSELGRSGHPRECCCPEHSNENERLKAKARAKQWRIDNQPKTRGRK